MPAPTSAQVEPDASTAALSDAGVISARSLARIRRALATTPPASVIDLREYVFVTAEAPEEVSLFGDVDLITGPVPFGPPTHFEMHGLAPPMSPIYSDKVERAVMAPFIHLGQAIAGLFTGDADPAPSVQPLLSDASREQVLAQIQGHSTVLEATLRQHGPTVALAIVVPTTISVEAAHQLGDDFVRMVTALAAVRLVSAAAMNASDYDFIVDVRTRTDGDIARGGRPSGSPRIIWRARPGRL